MVKKLFLSLGWLIASFNLVAAHTSGQGNVKDWHAPTIAAEISDMLQRHAERSNSGILGNTIAKSGQAFVLPFEEASKLSNECLEDTKKSGSIVELTVNTGFTLFASTAGYVASLISCLPAAAVGGLVGLKDGVLNSIRTKVWEDSFENVIALHLYLWIDAIKEARKTIGEKIKTWQTAHGETSIKKAVEEMLNNGALDTYTQETGTKPEALLAMLSKVDKNKDNWSDFFQALSAQFKTPKLSNQQWDKLQSTLISWPNKTDTFPRGTTEDDISQNLAFAVYFFLIANEHNSEILEKFLMKY